MNSELQVGVSKTGKLFDADCASCRREQNLCSFCTQNIPYLEDKAYFIREADMFFKNFQPGKHNAFLGTAGIVWDFYLAPTFLQELSENGGDENELMAFPPTYAGKGVVPSFIQVMGADILTLPVSGWTVVITFH